MRSVRTPGVPPGRPPGDALAEGAVVLDGGLSNQLRAQGCDLSDALWSARLLADAPEQIEAAHTAYVRAGAQVLITASYQATFEGFGRRGIGRDRAAEGRRRTGQGTFDPGPVRDWQRAGARLVGGCCRVGPSEIAEPVALRRPAGP